MKKHLQLKQVLAALLTIAALASGLTAQATVQAGIQMQGLTRTVNNQTMCTFVIQSEWGGDQIPAQTGSSYTFSNARMIHGTANVTLNGTLNFQVGTAFADVITSGSFTVTIESSSLWFYGATVQTKSGSNVSGCSASVSSNNHTLTVTIPSGKTFGAIIVDYVSNPPMTNSNTTVTVPAGDYWVSNSSHKPKPEPTVVYGQTTLVKDTDYTLSWSNNSSAGTGTVTVTGIGNYAGSATGIFYIRWAIYYVHFDKNHDDATGTISDQVFIYNTAQALTANTFSRTGYSFDGWSTTSNGAVTYTDGQSVNNLTAEDGQTVTLYAQWTPITYNIAYDLDGGNVATANPTSYNVTTNTFTLNNPTKTGYTFAGWTGSNGNTPQTTVTIAQGSIGDLSYTANWTPITYNITYDLDGGSVATANPTNYTIETPTFTLTNPTRTGYTFDGWTGSNGTTPQTTVTIAQGSIGDRSYTANWTPITYNITYDLDGGSVATANPTSYNVTTNTFTLNNPTKTGYTFDGWTGSNGSTPQTTVTINQGSIGDLSYTAHWTIITYNITYDLDGGSVATANPTTYDVETPTFTLTNPTKTGYTFAGWTGSNGNTPQTTVTITQGSIGDRSYTAHWTLNTYNIAYDLDGGSVAMANPTTYHIETATFTLNNPTRQGYTFAGWTGTDLNGPTMNVTIAQGSTGDRSYTATWNTITYNLTYDLVGGSVATANPSTYHIETATFTLNNPTREGYTFAGWTGTDLDEPTMNVTIAQGSIGDRSYTATWNTITYNITYDLAGGSITSANPETYNIETATFTLNNPTRTGYTFAGWTGTDLNGPTMNVTIAQGSIGDRSYTATWNTITYNLAYDLAGGSVATANPTTYTVETPTFTLNNPTKVACNFDGWTGSNGDTPETTVTIAQGSTGDRSYTAQWTQYAYALTLGTDITACGNVAITYEGTDYFTPGTIITLAYGGTIPEGYRPLYSVNGTAIVGDSFEMPATDVVVEAVLLERYYIYNSTTGELALIFGAFNKDNKWGSDVNIHAVTSVTATNEVSFTGDCYNLFYGFRNCMSMDLNNVNTDSVINMACMFEDCSSLDTLDLSGWNTEAVTIMSNMFYSCTKLKTLNLTGWDVSHVTNMPAMFIYCHGLTTIEGITQWNPQNVTTMNSMFKYCKSLKSLDLSGWNTASLIDMSVMFMECDSIQTLNLSGWDVSNITSMNCLFWGCKGLETLDVSGWDVSNVTNMGSMFYNCLSLTTIHRSEWNTENVTDMQAMFYRCSSLETLDLSDWNTENVTNMSSIFNYCSSLTTIYVGEGWSTQNVTNSGSLFYDCTSLVGCRGTTYDYQHVDVQYAHIDGGPDNPGYLSRVRYTFNPETGELVLRFGEFNKDNKWGSDVTPSAVTSVTATNQVSFTDNCSSLFADFSNCTSMDLNNVNTERVTNMANIFGSCTNLKTLNLTGWDVSLVTNMTSMFISCHSLTTIEGIKQWNPSNVTNMAAMFEHCKSLKSLDLSDWNTASLTDMNTMFIECDSIQTLNLSGWDVSKITTMEALFHNCTSLETLDVSGWDVSNVINMGVMFYGCSSLTTLNRSEWNTGNVTNMQAMFYGCSSLETLDISDWNTENVANMISMFIYCSNLTTIYVGEGWSAENAASVGNGMFYDCTSLVGGMGTTYNIQHTNGDYAHIDYGTANPGYFTARLTPVEYIDADGNTQTRTDYIVLEGSDDFASYGHDNVEAWYVVNHDVTYNDGVTFYGDVNLILVDGATLNLVNESEDYQSMYCYNNLTVYVQSGGTGTIVSNNVLLDVSENLTIHGGQISAETNGDAIHANQLTINGGTVSATVTEDGSAINADDVFINGGVVTTTNQQDGVGIYGSNNVTINGGIVTVNASGYYDGIFTYGTIMLGWTNESDRITASSYYGEVTVATGQAFSDETGHCYLNTLTDNQIAAIAGQTLSPFNDFGATFTITYMTNGGTLPEGYPATYTFAETVTLPIPTKEDNTFAGWYDNATFEGDPIAEITAGTTLGDKTFYALWHPEYIDVTYLDADGQTQTAHAKVLYGDNYMEEHEGGIYTVLEGYYPFYYILHFTGDATLILPDESQLDIAVGKGAADEEYGLYVDGNLTVFGQEMGTGGLTVSLIHVGGNVNIYGGELWSGGITSNNGNGTITLSWTAVANYIGAYEYNGNVVLAKDFMASDYDEGGIIVFPAGPVSDNAIINGKELYPYAETMDVSYIDENGATHTVNARVLFGGETSLDGGFYTVIGDVYFNHTLNFGGNTTLIVPDISHVYFIGVEGNGITVNGNLSIYGQAGREGTIIIYMSDAVNATGDVTVSNVCFYHYSDCNSIFSGGDILIAGGLFYSYGSLNASDGNGTITLGYLDEDDYIYCCGYEGTVKTRDGQKFYYNEWDPVILTGTLTAEEVAAIIGWPLHPYIEPITLTVEGYGDGDGGWYLIASPLIGNTNVENVGGLISTNPAHYDLYRFNPSNEDNEWENYKATSFNLEPGRGYLYANSDTITLTFTGVPVAGSTYEVTLVYDANDERKCWNLVGNPFNGNATLDREYYVLDSNGLINPEPVPANTPVPPCTAVFVKAETIGETVVITKVVR